VHSIFFGDSSFGTTKIFHMIDIPYEIRAGSKKFKVFHEIGSGIPVIQMNRIRPRPFLGQGWREGGL